MATTTFLTPFDMSDTSTASGFATNEATRIRVEDNQNTALATLRQDYTGTFTYSNGVLSGGTLTGLSTFSRANPSLSYTQESEVTGINVDAVQAFQRLTNADVDAFYSFIYSGNDTFTGSSGNDVINGYAGDDTINAGAGNDIIRPGNGDDTVDGGAGIDTVFLGHARSNYTITGSVNGTMTVAHSGAGGTDTLTNVEGVVFSEVRHGGTFRGGEAKFADVNGDGRADLIFQGGDNVFWVSLTDASGGLTAASRSVQHGGAYRNGGEVKYGDVNGDGRADMVFQGEDNTFWLSTSTGPGFTNAVRTVQHGGTYRNGGETNVIDVTGDGLADLIFQSDDNTFWLSTSTGAGFTNAVRTVQHGGTYRNGLETHFADVTGDGKADLVFQGGDNTFWLSEATGTGFTNAVRTVQHGGTYRNGGETHLADVTGDGKADLIFQGEDNTFWLSEATGTGFTNAVRTVQHGGAYRDGNEVHFADVNADSKADMIFQGADNTFWLSLSTGTGFTAASQILDLPDNYTAGQVQLADLNADSRADVIFQGADNLFQTSIANTDFVIT